MKFRNPEHPPRLTLALIAFGISSLLSSTTHKVLSAEVEHQSTVWVCAAVLLLGLLDGVVYLMWAYFKRKAEHERRNDGHSSDGRARPQG